MNGSVTFVIFVRYVCLQGVRAGESVWKSVSGGVGLGVSVALCMCA